MTRPILIAMVARGGSLPGRMRERLAGVADARGLSMHLIGDGAAVAVEGQAAVGTRTVIAGEVYARHSHFRRDLAASCKAVENGEGPHLAEACWGSFLALSCDGDAPVVLIRSAFGDLSCFWMEQERVVILATSPAPLEALSETPLTIDWAALGRYLLNPEMRTAETCLRGVRELPGGCTLTISPQDITVRQNWSPWRFTARQDPGLDAAVAARRVGEAVDRAVAARCRLLPDAVLLLSGGLDSSALAAALHCARIPFAGLNMVTRQRSGDERDYARAVAAALNVSFTETMRELDAIDWNAPVHRLRARPSARLFRQPTLAAAQQLAAARGVDTILDGGGGDNLFCSLTSVAPLLDRYNAEGLGRGTLQTARELALLTGVSVRTVLASAWRRHASGRIAYRWPVDCSFLRAGREGGVDADIPHPWLDPPPGTLPGQAAHAALVLGALSLAEDDSTDPTMRTLSPLVAQPVVEAVLQVPSWLWFEGGRNRAVIRNAYADRLPPLVLNRSGKGTPAGFMTEIVEANRDRLRTLLLDGQLVTHGIADRGAIETALEESGMDRDNPFDRLLVVADAELWARSWGG